MSALAPPAPTDAALAGPYCHACGEKWLDRHDYALGHYLEHAVDAFTHFDLKVPRSLWSLLRRPGVMTADVLAGRRVRWAKPLQVFLFANLIYYALATWLGLGTFETPLRYHLTSFYGDLARDLSGAKAAALGVPLDAYTERFDALAHTLAKTLVFFFVPVFTALFAVLQWGRRRYVLEHATASIHFTSLVLLLMPLPFPVVVALIAGTGAASGDLYWTLATALLFGVYAAVFFRRVYGDGRLASVLKALAVPFVFYAATIRVYRPLLFLIVNALL